MRKFSYTVVILFTLIVVMGGTAGEARAADVQLGNSTGGDTAGFEQIYRIKTGDSDESPRKFRMILTGKEFFLTTDAGNLIYNHKREDMTLYFREKQSGFRISRATLDQLTRRLSEIASLYKNRQNQLSKPERQNIQNNLLPGTETIDSLNFDLSDMTVTEQPTTWNDTPARMVNFEVHSDTQPKPRILGSITFLDEPLKKFSSEQESVLYGLQNFLDQTHKLLRSAGQIQQNLNLGLMDKIKQFLTHPLQIAEIRTPNFTISLEDHGPTTSFPKRPGEQQISTLNELIQQNLQQTPGGNGGLPAPGEVQ